MEDRKLYRGNLRDIVIVLAVASAFFIPVHYSLVIVAMVLLAAGTLLHIITKATLIRNRVLCTEGVYRICRHPYYLSNFIVDASLCLLSGNIYLVLAYPFLFFWAYGPTLRFEEQKLAGIHGEAVHEYLLSTPQIFPCMGSFAGMKTIFQETSTSRVSRNEWVRIARFWAVGISLIVIHMIAIKGVGILYKPPVDILAVVLTGIVVLLGVFSVVLRATRNRGVSEETE